MTCINCKDPGPCLCWTCARPVIAYAIALELIREIVRRLL